MFYMSSDIHIFSSYVVAIQSLYLVGSLEECLVMRGFRYHPSDLEASIIRCHKSICGR